MATLRNRRNRTDDEDNAVRIDPSADPNLSPILRDAIAGAAAGAAATGTGIVPTIPQSVGQESAVTGQVGRDRNRSLFARVGDALSGAPQNIGRTGTDTEAMEAMRDFASSGMTGIPTADVSRSYQDTGRAISDTAVRPALDVVAGAAQSAPSLFTPSVPDGDVAPAPLAAQPVFSSDAPIDDELLGTATDYLPDDPLADAQAPRSSEALPAGITRGADGEGGEFHWRGIPLSQIRAEEQARNLPPEVDEFGDITRMPTVGGYRWTQQRQAASDMDRNNGQPSMADYRSIARARGATGSQVDAEASRLMSEDQDRRALNAARVVSTIAGAEAVPERIRQADERIGVSRSRLESSEAEAGRRQERFERTAGQRDRSLDQRDRQLSTSERLAEQRIESAQAAIQRDLARLGFEERRTAAQEASTGERIAASQDNRQLARDRFEFLMNNPNAMQSTVNSIKGMVDAGDLSEAEGREALMRAVMGGRPPEGYLTWSELQPAQEQASGEVFDDDTERRLAQVMSVNNVDRETAIAAARQAGLIN